MKTLSHILAVMRICLSVCYSTWPGERAESLAPWGSAVAEVETPQHESRDVGVCGGVGRWGPDRLAEGNKTHHTDCH